LLQNKLDLKICPDLKIAHSFSPLLLYAVRSFRQAQCERKENTNSVRAELVEAYERLLNF